MRYDSKDTLAYILGIPQRRPYKLGEFLKAPQMAEAVKATKKLEKYASPDLEAVQFYAMNQMAAKVQEQYSEYEYLPEWAEKVASQYAFTLAAQSLRALHYTLLIITREARHLKMKESFFASKEGSTTPPAFQKFIAKIGGTGSDGAVEAFLQHAPDVTMAEYVSGVRKVFNHGSFSSSFGGKPWGRIAQTLENFVTGATSGEIFVDTVYTLAHNNGPIFNKGMYYHHYSSDLAHILDVQRSGQVCELVREGTYKSSIVNNTDSTQYETLRQMIEENADRLGIGGYVDWFKVEALGSLKSYSALKQAQIKKHGIPTSGTAKKAPPKVVLFDGKPAKEVGSLYVMPEQAVTVLQRITAEVK